MEARYENSIQNGWNGSHWLFDRMNGVLREINPENRPMAPRVDVIEDKDGYHLYFEMPGLKNETIDVRVENDRLLVEAERKRPEWPEGTQVLIAERNYGAVRRAFEMPADANATNVHAAYKDGVLEVTVEKRAEAKPVKIQIN